MDAEKALATLATERGYIHTTPEKLARDLARDDWTLVPTVATGQQLVRLSDDLLAAEAEIARLLAAVEIVRRHTHQGLLAMTYHAGPDPENDCLLCRALVDAGVLTLDGIGAGTRAAILAERAALAESPR